MNALPPYSSFRTDSKMMYPQSVSHGNVLSFKPPGLNQVLNVKFPDSRLAVCEKCKKNYKTRDMCRVRNSHTEEPWSTAYICITLDMTCTDSTGTKYVDKPFQVRMNPWQPYCVKTPFDAKTPVCAGCKKTNRTRSFCRERHQHRQLPWCTVYVTLTAVDTNASPLTAVTSTPGAIPEPVPVINPTTTSTGIAHSVKIPENNQEVVAALQASSDAVVEAVHTVGIEAPASSTDVKLNNEHATGTIDQTQQIVDENKKELSPVEAVREAFTENKLPTEMENVTQSQPTTEQALAEVKVENDAESNNAITQQAPEEPAKQEPTPASLGDAPAVAQPPCPKANILQEGDDIHKIEPSRTFLAKVSCRSTTIHWLELAEMDSATAAGFYHQSDGVHSAINAAMRSHHPGMVPPQMPPHMDPSAAAASSYYPGAPMNYTAAAQQQHQNALKMQQHHFLMHQRQQHQQFAAWQAYNQQMHMVQQQQGVHNGQQQQQVTGHNPQQGKVLGAPPLAGDVLSQENAPQGIAQPPTGDPAANQIPPHTPQPAPISHHQIQPQAPGSYPPPPNMPQQQAPLTPTQTTNPQQPNEAPTTPSTAAAMAAQQQAQWQAHMMYQQQFYQQQYQMQQQQAAAGGAAARPVPPHMIQHPIMMPQPQHAGMPTAQPGVPMPQHAQGQAMMMTTHPAQPMQGQQQPQSLPAQQPVQNGQMITQQQHQHSQQHEPPHIDNKTDTLHPPGHNAPDHQDQSLFDPLSSDDRKKRPLEDQLEEVDQDLDPKRLKLGE